MRFHVVFDQLFSSEDVALDLHFDTRMRVV